MKRKKINLILTRRCYKQPRPKFKPRRTQTVPLCYIGQRTLLRPEQSLLAWTKYRWGAFNLTRKTHTHKNQTKTKKNLWDNKDLLC